MGAYQLTPKMQQAFRQNLEKYHELFDGIRCDSWQLEELIYKSILADNLANHHARWSGVGHDDKADIRVKTPTQDHYIQIKSGVLLKKGYLRLSGHRLGRFGGNLSEITDYLNGIEYEIISIPYSQINDSHGRHHVYRVVYVDRVYFKNLNCDNWELVGKMWKQKNEYGVLFSIGISQSWQIWWRIPINLLNMSDDIVIG